MRPSGVERAIENLFSLKGEQHPHVGDVIASCGPRYLKAATDGVLSATSRDSARPLMRSFDRAQRRALAGLPLIVND
jgi:hypothetical protein